MGSRNLTGGAGFRPAFAGRRDLVTFLDQLSHATADNFYARYKAPLGGGAHLAVKECDPDTPFVVGSAIPGLSFTPGQSIILGSNSGQPGDVINGAPPPGRGGGSRFGATVARRSLSFGVPELIPPPVPRPACPLLITDRDYLAVAFNFSTKKINSWHYHDGDYIEDVGPEISYSGIFSLLSFGTLQAPQRVLQGSDEIVIFKAQAPTSSRPVIVSANVTAGTLALLEPYVGSQTATHRIAGPVWPGSGSFYYFARVQQSGGNVTIQMNRAAFDAVGTDYEELPAPSSPFLDSSGLITISGTNGNSILATATDLQVPLAKTGGGIIPYYTLADDTWHDGTGRGTTLGEFNSGSIGYPIASGSLGKVNDSFGGQAYLAPAGPGAVSSATLSVGGFISVNEAGDEWAMYQTNEEGGLFRAVIPILSDSWNACEFRPRIPVENGPTGDTPLFMLARD